MVNVNLCSDEAGGSIQSHISHEVAGQVRQIRIF